MGATRFDAGEQLELVTALSHGVLALARAGKVALALHGAEHAAALQVIAAAAMWHFRREAQALRAMADDPDAAPEARACAQQVVDWAHDVPGARLPFEEGGPDR